MEIRYTKQTGAISSWNIPDNEKRFFIVYAMNTIMDGDGFNCLSSQDKLDIDLFINTLWKLGAVKTSSIVKSTIGNIRNNHSNNVQQETGKYYKLFSEENVWSKLYYNGGRKTMNYYMAKAVSFGKDNMFNPKKWENI